VKPTSKNERSRNYGIDDVLGASRVRDDDRQWEKLIFDDRGASGRQGGEMTEMNEPLDLGLSDSCQHWKWHEM